MEKIYHSRTNISTDVLLLMTKVSMHIYIIVVITVLSIVGCTGCGDTKDGVAGDAGRADFEQRMSVADSLFNSMQFRDAYDLYLQLLNNPVAEADSEKKLNVLSSISNASELSGHKAEETKWLQQQLDLAKETGNSYYHDFKARYNISPTEYRRR